MTVARSAHRNLRVSRAGERRQGRCDGACGTRAHRLRGRVTNVLVLHFLFLRADRAGGRKHGLSAARVSQLTHAHRHAPRRAQGSARALTAMWVGIALVILPSTIVANASRVFFLMAARSSSSGRSSEPSCPGAFGSRSWYCTQRAPGRGQGGAVTPTTALRGWGERGVERGVALEGGGACLVLRDDVLARLVRDNRAIVSTAVLVHAHAHRRLGRIPPARTSTSGRSSPPVDRLGLPSFA